MRLRSISAGKQPEESLEGRRAAKAAGVPSGWKAEKVADRLVNVVLDAIPVGVSGYVAMVVLAIGKGAWFASDICDPMRFMMRIALCPDSVSRQC